jgi:uncharacterized protein (DUF433 family)
LPVLADEGSICTRPRLVPFWSAFDPSLGVFNLPVMDWRNRIITDPAICHGKACIKGTRIMASVVLDNLANSLSAAEIVRLYPTLTLEDVAAAMAYAAELARERVVLTSAA